MTLHLTHEQLCDLILADLSLQPEGELWNDQKSSWRNLLGSKGSGVLMLKLKVAPFPSIVFW